MVMFLGSAEQWSSWSDCKGNCRQSLQEFRSSQKILGERSRSRRRTINSKSDDEIEIQPCNPECKSGGLKGSSCLIYFQLFQGIDCAMLAVQVNQTASGPVYSLETVLARPSHPYISAVSLVR